jgi:hypothetical protein
MQKPPLWLHWVPHISLQTANAFYAWGWRASFIGALITFGGIAFLYWGTHVRDQDTDSRLAHLNKQAAEATSLAAQLGVKVDALPTFVAEKERILTSLAAQMTTTAAALDRASEEAKASQAHAEAALESFRREAGPRVLSDAQSKMIVSILHNKISMKVTVQSDPGDVEAYPFAQQILGSVKLAGIDSEWQPWPTLFTWFNEPGVFVVTSGEVDKRQADLILAALNAAGLDAKPAHTSEDRAPKPPTPGSLSIVVWKRPPPSPPN